MVRRSPSEYGEAIGGCPETCRSSLIMPTHNGLVILTMDEGHVANHVLTLLIGPRIHEGVTKNVQVNHYNVLKTVTDNFGLRALGNCVGVRRLY